MALFIFPLVLAIAATVLAFIFFVPEKNRDKYGTVGRILHDIFNFKFLVIEKVFQALYILSTAYTILTGFFLLFYVEKGYSGYYYSTPTKWYGGYGLLLMILGPIAVRIAYELLMMLVLLIKNVIQINSKIKDSNDNQNKDDIFATPIPSVAKAPEAPATPATPVVPVTPEVPVAPEAPVAPIVANNFCTDCGKEINPGSSFCPYCGKKLQ